ILELSRRRVIVNRLLQRLGFRAELRAALAAAVGVATIIVAAVVATATPAAKPSTTATLTRGLLRIQDLLEKRLDRTPVRVVWKIKLLPDVVQSALLHLRGIEIAAVAAAVPASAPVAKAATIAATTAVAATSVNLREGVAKAHSEGQGHRAHRNHAIQFHKTFF